MPSLKNLLGHSGHGMLGHSGHGNAMVATLCRFFVPPSMVPIRAAKAWGLRVVQPIDIRYGVGLHSRDSRRWL